MAEVSFTDEQTAAQIDGARLVDLARFVLSQEAAPARVQVGMLAIGAERMADLNERYMQESGPTDVLAFPIDDATEPTLDMAPDMAPDFPMLLGDIVLCPTVAAENAAEHDCDLVSELDLLCVHGVLHLLGYDHIDDNEAEQMEARERQLLSAFAGNGRAE